MQVHEQGHAPAIAQPLQFAAERRVVGGVDARDPVLELCFLQRPSPDFAIPGSGGAPAPAHYATAVGERMAHRTHAGAAHHTPIDILDRTIEIDHRAWCFRDQQACLRFGRDRLGYQIDITILEPQLGFTLSRNAERTSGG